MKIVVITGSAHKYGTSETLAEHFIRGAQEAGHQVRRFDAGFATVHPCTGCLSCRGGQEGCVFHDDMDTLYPDLLSADAVVFASGIYYYGVTAFLKTVIDRFYAYDASLHGKKKAVMLLTCADEEAFTPEGSLTTFRHMLGYLQWENAGELTAYGCSVRAELDASDYPRRAYEMGRMI